SFVPAGTIVSDGGDANEAMALPLGGDFGARDPKSFGTESSPIIPTGMALRRWKSDRSHLCTNGRGDGRAGIPVRSHRGRKIHAPHAVQSEARGNDLSLDGDAGHRFE